MADTFLDITVDFSEPALSGTHSTFLGYQDVESQNVNSRKIHKVISPYNYALLKNEARGERCYESI